MKKVKYKVGDLIQLKPDLKKDARYGGVWTSAKIALLSRNRQVVEIKEMFPNYGNTFYIKGCYALLSSEMIDGLANKYKVDIF